MTNIEIAMKAIRDEAERAGDAIEHIWAMDLQDGTFNVKAIVRSAAGTVATVGCRVAQGQ